jgi:hypothetical protein
MDTRSLTRPPRPSTRAVVAGAHLCDQISALLLIEANTTRQVFLGEPVEEVMAMVKRALKHEGEAEFAPERILPTWAQKRGRGYWRTEDPRVEECHQCHGTGWEFRSKIGDSTYVLGPPAKSQLRDAR